MDHGPNALLASLRRLPLAPVVGLVLFAGCATTGPRSPDDVLLGGTPSAPRPIPPPGRPTTAVAGATTPLPPPPPGTSSSLASLTAASNPAAETARTPRTTGVTPVPSGRGGATLHGPQPVDEPVQRITPVGATGPAASVATPGSAAQDSYQQVMEKLKARGMTWMRLETTGESGWWKFSCTIADRQNPGIEQRYEASGYGEGGLAALRAVLEKIDHPEP